MIARELAAGIRMLYSGTARRGVRAGLRALLVRGLGRAAPRGGVVRRLSTPTSARDLARALKTVLLKYDGLWNTPFPYMLAFHQAPTDGQPHPEAHLHAEFYPAYRMPGRLKYLAGSEIGAGVFTADTLPEEKVKELQAVQVDVDA